MTSRTRSTAVTWYALEQDEERLCRIDAHCEVSAGVISHDSNRDSEQIEIRLASLNESRPAVGVRRAGARAGLLGLEDLAAWSREVIESDLQKIKAMIFLSSSLPQTAQSGLFAIAARCIVAIESIGLI